MATVNCNFIIPYSTNGDILIDLENSIKTRESNKCSLRGKYNFKRKPAIHEESSSNKISGPENQGEELIEEIEKEFGKAAETIGEELSELTIYWRMITFGVNVFVLSLIIIVIKLKFDSIRPECLKSSKKRQIPTIPIEVLQTTPSNESEMEKT
ncbi:hypothetical protein DINM_006447 [Dirofilaria immitis]|nr:hypothetical protein [Dirofilaria immitis]